MASIGEENSNRGRRTAAIQTSIGLTERRDVHERLMRFARRRMRFASVHADGKEPFEMSLMLQRVLQMGALTFQIPAESHRRVLFVEEVRHRRFMQTEINEFANGSVENQCETEIFRKVEMCVPTERRRSTEERGKPEDVTIETSERCSRSFPSGSLPKGSERLDSAPDRNSSRGNVASIGR